MDVLVKRRADYARRRWRGQEDRWNIERAAMQVRNRNGTECFFTLRQWGMAFEVESGVIARFDAHC